MDNKNNNRSPHKRILLAALLLTFTAGIILLSIHMLPSLTGEHPVDNPIEIKDQPKEPGKSKPAAKKTARRPVAAQPVRYKSNQEIKEAYGMIEKVTLYNGKSYTGAVKVLDQEKYKMITVEGEVTIPMNEVKMRDIIQ